LPCSGVGASGRVFVQAYDSLLKPVGTKRGPGGGNFSVDGQVEAFEVPGGPLRQVNAERRRLACSSFSSVSRRNWPPWRRPKRMRHPEMIKHISMLHDWFNIIFIMRSLATATTTVPRHVDRTSNAPFNRKHGYPLTRRFRPQYPAPALMTARLPIILNANMRTISPQPPRHRAGADRRRRQAWPPAGSWKLGRQHPQPAHAPGQRPRGGGSMTWREDNQVHSIIGVVWTNHVRQGDVPPIRGQPALCR
jgi:hypothetical protein